jgi:hypothetical protein
LANKRVRNEDGNKVNAGRNGVFVHDTIQMPIKIRGILKI